MSRLRQCRVQVCAAACQSVCVRCVCGRACVRCVSVCVPVRRRVPPCSQCAGVCARASARVSVSAFSVL